MEEFMWQQPDTSGDLPCGCQAATLGIGSNNCSYNKVCTEIFTNGIKDIDSASVSIQCVEKYRLDGSCVVTVGYLFTLNYTDCRGRSRTKSASGFTVFFEESTGLCNFTVEALTPPEVVVCGNRAILKSKIAVCK